MFFTTVSAPCAIFIPVYFIPLYFQHVRNDSALYAGIQLRPFVVFNVTTAMLNGLDMSKSPYYMPWPPFLEQSSRKVQGVSDELQQKILHIVVKAISKAYVLPVVAGASTLLMALFMKREKLNLRRPG
ncbi:hypothetical protein BOTCAL_0176g00140 [Botryotinia calthae]|uniref:Uncharacterized protein n=1 Tax=Botryotinia calthae TaxID=38488 RepID=A0A4Y8D0Z3_9HELO|nr:hypothetical protein BOTCAL_0176g00140 [Botryotinia calthae]